MKYRNREITDLLIAYGGARIQKLTRADFMCLLLLSTMSLGWSETWLRPPNCPAFLEPGMGAVGLDCILILSV
jgi:hypothetical protein